MSGDVIRLPSANVNALQTVADRLKTIAGLLHTIQNGELLAAFPDCPLAFEHHKSALCILTVIEFEVVSACLELNITLPV